MVIHMRKTTINIEDAIMERLKEEAARRNTTMGALVEAGIRRILGEGEAPAPVAAELPPLPLHHMGKPLVDLADREALYEVLDRERDEELYGAPHREELHAPRVRMAAEEIEPYDAGPPAPGQGDAR